MCWKQRRTSPQRSARSLHALSRSPESLLRLFSKQQMDDHFSPGLWRGPISHHSDGSAKTTNNPTRLEYSSFVKRESLHKDRISSLPLEGVPFRQLWQGTI